jgi:hypothetical protein
MAEGATPKKSWNLLEKESGFYPISGIITAQEEEVNVLGTEKQVFIRRFNI